MGESAKQLNIASIERTFNTELVRSIIGNKKLFWRSGGFPIEMYDPENQKDLYYLTPMRDGIVLGVIVFHVFNSMVCYQGHVNYLPEHWGGALYDHTNDAINWMFKNTECIKVVALIPDFYPVVLRHAIDAGMKKEGYLIKSVLSNGKIDNLTLVGIEK